MKKIILAVISAIMVTGFNSCKQSANTQGTQSTQIERSSVAVSGLKIAYIDVDSLLLFFFQFHLLSYQVLFQKVNQVLFL
jgi:hypothetical protein